MLTGEIELLYKPSSQILPAIYLLRQHLNCLEISRQPIIRTVICNYLSGENQAFLNLGQLHKTATAIILDFISTLPSEYFHPSQGLTINTSYRFKLKKSFDELLCKLIFSKISYKRAEGSYIILKVL